MNLPRPFGDYTLLKRLAVGGMAEVYVARAIGIGGFERLVAIKVIHPRLSEDAHFVRMLVEEAKINVLLTHNNIAQCFDLGCIDGTYFIVMEYIDGADAFRTLRRAEARNLKLPFELCAYVIAEVCKGLDYAHRRRDSNGDPLGIVHRDVSPQNVLLSYTGDVKLVDFGIAKAAMRSGQTEVGVIKGKYYYMSPEQAWGDPMDHRTDIFSTGIVLHELLTGEMVYREDNIPALLDRVRKAQIAPPTDKRPDTPAELVRIVMKALQKDSKDRYQSAHDMGQDLWAFVYAVAPSFTSQRLAELMMSLFNIEHSRNLVGPVPISGGDTGRTSAPNILTSMSREDFSPDVTKSVLFDSSDDTRAGRMKAPNKEVKVDEPDQTLRPRGLAGPRAGVLAAAAPEPQRALPSMLDDDNDEDEATIVSANRYGWDEATLVDSSGEVRREVDARLGARSSSDHDRTATNDLAVAGVPTAPQGRARSTEPEGLTHPQPMRATSVEPWAAATEPRSPASAPGPPSTVSAHPFPSPPAAFPDVGLPASPAADPFVAQAQMPLDTRGFPIVETPSRGRLAMVLLVLFVAALAGGGFMGGLWFARPERPAPVLRVLSVPPGAAVSLDAREVQGVTPLEITGGLTVGRNHILRVSKPGYETWTTTFQPAHGIVEQRAELVPRRTAVTVRTEPSGALVRVDGVLVGASPVELPSVQIGRQLEILAEDRERGRATRTFVVPDEPNPEVVLTFAAP